MKTSDNGENIFIEREQEMKALLSCYEIIENSHKTIILFIRGEFGVGKTSLVEKFLADIQLKNPENCLIGRGKCSLESELNSLVPFSQIINDLIKQGTKLRIITPNIKNFLLEVAPAWLDIITFKTASAVATTVKESIKLFSRSAYSPDNIYNQYKNMLIKFSAKKPIIAFIDDIHWADISSMELLFHLSRNLKDQPILFICTYRPIEALEKSKNASLFREIRANILRDHGKEIEILNGLDVQKYTNKRYPRNSFPEKFVHQVEKKTGGHALFTCELFSLLEDNDRILVKEDLFGKLWYLTEGDVSLSIPNSISEVMEQRLIQLDEEMVKILEFASIEGEEFSAQTIECMSDKKEEEILRKLEDLENRYQFLKATGSKETDTVTLDTYKFSHNFFREYIYNRISNGRQRILHRKIGECLEGRYNTKLEIAGQIANHFRISHDYFKCLQYMIIAIENEQNKYSWSGGQQWADSAFEILNLMSITPESEKLRIEFLIKAGYGFYNLGEYSKAHGLFQTALEVALKIVAPSEKIAEIYSWLGDVCDYEGESIEQSISYYELALNNIKDCHIENEELYLAISADYSYMLERKGEVKKSLEEYAKIINRISQIPRTPTLRNLEARVYNYLGIAYGNIGDFPKASDSYNQCIKICDEIGCLALLKLAIGNKADDCYNRGELNSCLDLANQSLELAIKTGNEDDIAYARATIAKVFIAQNKLEDAKRLLVDAINISERVNANWNMAYMYADLSIIHLLLNNITQAEIDAQKAVSFGKRNSYILDRGYALIALGRVKAAEQDYESSIEILNAAFTDLSNSGYLQYATKAKLFIAEILYRMGKIKESLDLINKVIPYFSENNLRLDLEMAQVLKNKLINDKKE